ncbi:MAG: hypothetical protein KDI61_07540 [Alphaproteobacteria bacterium]|nr:hypothetical protein [Alphaproteobacteria bacterium]
MKVMFKNILYFFYLVCVLILAWGVFGQYGYGRQVMEVWNQTNFSFLFAQSVHPEPSTQNNYGGSPQRP